MNKTLFTIIAIILLIAFTGGIIFLTLPKPSVEKRYKNIINIAKILSTKYYGLVDNFNFDEAYKCLNHELISEDGWADYVSQYSTLGKRKSIIVDSVTLVASNIIRLNIYTLFDNYLVEEEIFIEISGKKGLISFISFYATEINDSNSGDKRNI